MPIATILLSWLLMFGAALASTSTTQPTTPDNPIVQQDTDVGG